MRANRCCMCPRRDCLCNDPSKHIAHHNLAFVIFQSYEASLSWNLKGHRGHTTSGNEHCDMAQETCVLTRLPKIGWRCSQVILDCPGAARALKSSTLQAAKVHELWAVGVPSSSSRSMYSCWLEPIHLIRKPAVWLTTLRSWPNSQLLQPGYRCFGVSSSGFELMQPYWKLPCCRRSTTLIVLRGTSRTEASNFFLGTNPTARAAQQHAREEEDKLPSSFLLLLITTFLICPETASQKNWNGFHHICSTFEQRAQWTPQKKWTPKKWTPSQKMDPLPKNGPPQKWTPPKNGPPPKMDPPKKWTPQKNGPPPQNGPPPPPKKMDPPPRNGPLPPPKKWTPPPQKMDPPPHPKKMDPPPQKMDPPKMDPSPPQKNGPPKNGPPKMDPQKWTPKNGPPKMDPQKWTPKNGPPKMDPQKWTPKNGPPKMDPQKWTPKNGPKMDPHGDTHISEDHPDFGQNEFDLLCCVVCCLCGVGSVSRCQSGVSCVVLVSRFGLDRPSPGPPFPWTAQNFALFFSLRKIRSFLLSLKVFSWTRTLKCARLRVPAFKTTPKFHERAPRERKDLWWEREKEREILGPPLRGERDRLRPISTANSFFRVRPIRFRPILGC